MPKAEKSFATRIWRLPMLRIEQVVSAHLGPGRVRGNEQKSCFSRQVSMYLALHVGGWSTPKIGRFYCGRHHTTVLHAVSKIERLRRKDEAVEAVLEVLTSELAAEVETRQPEPPQLNWRDTLMKSVADRIAERFGLEAISVPVADCRYPIKSNIGTNMAVTLTLEIPEDLAAILGSPDRDLSRTALEALAVEEYRARRLSDAQFRRLLDVSRFEADRILKAHGVWLDYDMEDFEREGAATQQI
jgi:predicted HTH domain antitoxin